ncbi:unnamed protein product [Allacma fusca]|uniref:Uncharacterized protein n=1 Tax=Allacma fusca TaxID=39272 RepID=A0A8J2LSP8_9HEXA|nr:unnamed protein product [Allacma fusca]
MFQLTILCLCLPSLILAVPANDEVLKQQIASDLLKNDESPYWNLLRPDTPIQLQLRSIDSLGHGHILRNLAEGDSSWLGGNGGNNGWRLTGYSGNLKRGGGLDSLGRGNILRSIPEDYQRYMKSLDSLGRGNILKRSTRDFR